MSEVKKDIIIPEYAKVKVYWSDRPENYSREAKLEVRDYFANKYNINKNNINVVYQPVKIGNGGEVIEISGAGIENILDKNYQLELMKEWFKREAKTIDFKRIIDLDSKVNELLENNVEVSDNKHWSLKWLFIDNFLCFGEKNFISFNNLNGLNIVTSEPPNQGGKTTFSVDAIKFLLFGKTTKTDKNEEIFNTFTDKNELIVRGMLDIGGFDTIIERKLIRRAKRNGGWNITNNVSYYRLLPDGEEELLNEEDSKQTSEVIKNAIGSERDFDITILATGRNLEDLIDAKPTESGRLLTKFIGLEVIEEKEIIAKKMSSDFNKNKKGNHYNVTTLLNDNELLTNTNIENNANLVLFKDSLKKSEEKINKLEKERERLLNSKIFVDVEITQLNPETIQKNIDLITEEGKIYANKIKEYKNEINLLKDYNYDEFLYDKLEKNSRTLTIEIGSLKSEVVAIGKVIDNLRDNEICQSCKRSLEGVDNSKSILENEKKIEATNGLILKKVEELEKIDSSIAKMRVNKERVDIRHKLELEKDKADVEIKALRNKIKSKMIDLKNYESNKNAIKTNSLIDADISSVKTDIIIEIKNRDNIKEKIFILTNEIEKNENQIIENIKLIKTLKREEEVEKVFKVYLEMIGKKGISKLVLRSVLPIINSELYRLLEDVCDYEVELEMNDKNEVEFTLIKSDVSKPLKSGSGLETTFASLALRCVLSKVSHLPKPNFISFDEVLGKIAPINIEKMKPMFEKITDMFDIVFLITHNDLVKDWGDKIITVKKVNNVSKLNN